MKIKTVIISVVVTGAMVGGIGYGAYYSMQSQKKPVDVVPVQNVNYSYWGGGSTMSGMIISKNSQSVQLNSDYELVKVFVETGDEVKIGDPLLEYDMVLTELKREMEDLTKQGLELNLASMEKNLQKLQNTRPTASLDLNDGTFTGASMEDGLIEDAQEGVSGSASSGPAGGNTAGSASSGPAGGVSARSDDGSDGSLIEDDGSGDTQPGSGTGTEQSGGGTVDTQPDGGTGTEQPGGGTVDTQPDGGSEDEAGDIIVDDEVSGDNSGGMTGGEGSNGMTGGDGSNDMTGGDGSASGDDLIMGDNGDTSEEGALDPEQMVKDVNAFLTRVNQLSGQELDQLIVSDISEALRIYREKLAAAEELEIRDVLGETRIQKSYSLRPEVLALVGENTALVLSQAYDRACVYQLIYCINQLNPEDQAVDELTDEAIRGMESQIRAAVDAYYDLPGTVFGNEEYKEVMENCTGELTTYIARLNRIDVLEETEPSTEEMSEFPGDFGDFGDFGGFGDDGMSYTAEELRQAIEDQKREIDECQLQIRESELKLKQFQRELDNKIVKSDMNGIVQSAGTLEDAVADEDFIVITGAAGMYVQGSLNEMKLDTVSVGDMVQGMSYDSGMNFTATITEISPYPTDNHDNYYGYGGDNNNSSYYPFLAYIEDAEGLSEGYVDLQMVDNTPTTGIYLEKYFIRTESNGKNYVYLQGSDGLLKKQYVKTGSSLYGVALEIKDGVTMQDKIAFPYGKDVVEGAATQEVDSLYSSYGYYG